MCRRTLHQDINCNNALQCSDYFQVASLVMVQVAGTWYARNWAFDRVQETDSAGKKLSGSIRNALVFVAAITVMTFLIVLLYKYRVRFMLARCCEQHTTLYMWGTWNSTSYTVNPGNIATCQFANPLRKSERAQRCCIRGSCLSQVSRNSDCWVAGYRRNHQQARAQRWTRYRPVRSALILTSSSD
jgi:hypothetical protein